MFNSSWFAMHREHFFLDGDLVEIVGSYTYLGILFLRPIFTMRPAMQARLNRCYASLAWLERQCYHSHFQDLRSKSLLFDSLVCPTGIYGSSCCRPDLSDMEWMRVEHFQILMLVRMIRSKPLVPHHIILIEFGASPL